MINSDSSLTMQTSLNVYKPESKTDSQDVRGRYQVLMSIFSKPMETAKYFCAGVEADEAKYAHYALSVPLYTHFTSPIRRYPDILVHR